MWFVLEGDEIVNFVMCDYMIVLVVVIGDFVIMYLFYGGIYFIGGVFCVVMLYFDSFGFVVQMVDKGEFNDLLSGFVVMLIDDDFVVFKGCVCYLRQILD